MGRLAAAVLLLLDFLPFRGVAFEMQNEIKCKQDEDKGKEGRMSSAGGDSNPLRCLPYTAFIKAINVGEKQTARHSRMPRKQTGPLCAKVNSTQSHVQTTLH